jgi:hypothetical protein
VEVGLDRKQESIPSFFETTQMLILMRHVHLSRGGQGSGISRFLDLSTRIYYSPTLRRCSSYGHYHWCVTNLSNQHYWNAIE